MNGAQTRKMDLGFVGECVRLLNVLVVEKTEKALNEAKIVLTWEENAELVSYCNTAEGGNT